MAIKILPLPSQERLLRSFVYDPETGTLRRIDGRKASDASGLVRVGPTTVDGVQYTSYRIIWKMMTGYDPIHDIDHRDGDVQNCKWENLREATRSQNATNRRVLSRTNRHKGVTYNYGSWVARITVDGVEIHIGRYKSEQEAGEAYRLRSEELHRAFALSRRSS